MSWGRRASCAARATPRRCAPAFGGRLTQVYGTSIKAVIHEMFGDGIMSAIDFDIDIRRVEDPKGDRVQVVYTGKFLPYKKW